MEKSMIQIKGNDDEGSWTIKSFDRNRKEHETRTAERFGVLCYEIIDLLKGKNQIYDINYLGEYKHIFEKPEEDVIYRIVDLHNNLVNLKKSLTDII